MSKILPAKQSRCLKPKHSLVLIYTEQNLREGLLNYPVVEIIFWSVCFTGLTREDKAQHSPVFPQHSLCAWSYRWKLLSPFPIPDLNIASRNHLGTKRCMHQEWSWKKKNLKKPKRICEPLVHTLVHFGTLPRLKCCLQPAAHEATAGAELCSFTLVQVYRDCAETHPRKGLPQLCQQHISAVTQQPQRDGRSQCKQVNK